MSATPRVTIGIPTFNRDTYLAEAIRSCLAQDYDSFEVLVLMDGTTNPRVPEVIAEFEGDERLRVIRHEQNLGIPAAINTIFREARGEVIATCGDDDVCLPDRLSRQMAIFDRYPDTGVVHGDALVIDGRGKVLGPYRSRDFSRRELVDSLFRLHNYLIDPTTLRHKKVWEALGGCDEDLMWEDFDFHVRAARLFRYRHCGGGPVMHYRRHGDNASDESAQEREVALVTEVLDKALGIYDLHDLVPELDWHVIDRREGERRALEILAHAFEHRQLALPELARRTRERAAALEPAPAAPAAARGSRGHILFTSFGYNDSGGGTLVPRLLSKELVRRGYEVTVFHAAVKPIPNAPPYSLSEREEDGVRLVGVHNRPHGLLDLGNPHREIDDPPITRAFAETLDRLKPDVVHFHNLHNLGAALLDEVAARGIPSLMSAHNHWLICPRNYLLKGDGSLCAGPGSRGADCASCVGSRDTLGYEQRLAEIRARASRALEVVLAPSEAVKRALVAAGYPDDLVDVLPQTMPHSDDVWEKVGRSREPARTEEPLRIGFFGSVYPHKGPQLLVEAVQRLDADVRVELHGEVPDPVKQALLAADTRGVVDVCGAFAPHELPDLLRGIDVAVMPSICWDAQVLTIAECLAARVPVVAARMGGMPDGVRDGVDGLLFDGWDVDGLAAALGRLAHEPGLLERLQANIAEPDSFASYVDALEAHYAGERPARGRGERQPLAVRWIGDHTLPTSLSIINQRVCERLDADEWHRAHPAEPGASRITVQRVARDGSALDSPLPHLAGVEVRHQWPPDFSPAPAGRLALIQPWEFGAAPKDWIASLRENVDELWVPSQFVRGMYVSSGLEPERVHVVPNGVDVELFNPDAVRLALNAPEENVKLLFVGGVIGRKGPDVLLDAYARAFAGRDDVTLVIKDFGANGVYRGADRDQLREWVEAERLPRIEYIERELSDEEMAGLYRACDVLVHPYRGEGFGMPVLEAMACGLPVVITAGGPTDEFCPDEACWRIRSSRREIPGGRVGDLETAGTPWMLEPDAEHLSGLLVEAVTDGAARASKGAAGAVAARALSWDAVAQRYSARLRALAAAPEAQSARSAEGPPVFEEEVGTRVLAAPAWRADGNEGIEDLLSAWATAAPAGTDACLYLLAGPSDDADSLTAAVLGAAERAGADLERCADITIYVSPTGAAGDAALHEAMDAYVTLPGSAPGHLRRAQRVLEPNADALRELLGGELQAAA